jgi:hypothetical protein
MVIKAAFRGKLHPVSNPASRNNNDSLVQNWAFEKRPAFIESNTVATNCFL